jgi:hypothetical protein
VIADLFILAQQPERDPPGWGTLIYVVIFLLIWIISAIVNVLNKRQQRRRMEVEEEEEWEPVVLQEPRRREMPPPPPRRMPERAPQRPVERRVERPPVVVERRPPARVEPAPPPLPTPEMPRTQRQVRQAPTPRREFPTGATARQPDRRFPTAQRRVPITETQVSTEVLRRTEIGSGGEQQSVAAGRPATTAAPAIAQMLQATTLRQNFILTEILQVPKGLRPLE